MSSEFPRTAHELLMHREASLLFENGEKVPCQIVRTARRVIYRVLGYNSWLADFFAMWKRLQELVLVE